MASLTTQVLPTVINEFMNFVINHYKYNLLKTFNYHSNTIADFRREISFQETNVVTSFANFL